MRLVSPNGVEIHTNDIAGERLKLSGWRERAPKVETPDEPAPSPKRRGRPTRKDSAK